MRAENSLPTRGNATPSSKKSSGFRMAAPSARQTANALGDQSRTSESGSIHFLPAAPLMYGTQRIFDTKWSEHPRTNRRRSTSPQFGSQGFRRNRLLLAVDMPCRIAAARPKSGKHVYAANRSLVHQ